MWEEKEGGEKIFRGQRKISVSIFLPFFPGKSEAGRHRPSDHRMNASRAEPCHDIESTGTTAVIFGGQAESVLQSFCTTNKGFCFYFCGSKDRSDDPFAWVLSFESDPLGAFATEH